MARCTGSRRLTGDSSWAGLVWSAGASGRCLTGTDRLRIVDRVATTMLVVATLALTAPAALWGQTPGSIDNAPTDCRALVDDRDRPLDDGVVRWHRREEVSQRNRLDRQCRTLGPMVLLAEPAAARLAVTRSLMVINWNVHVGGGDVEQLLDRLSLNQPDDTSGSHYILLLEEAFRSGALVPAAIEPGVGVPRRITPRSSQRLRDDIVSVAQRRGLALYYVPSMRNGRGQPHED